MLSMLGSSALAPKPGWMGTISRNRSASGSMASKPVTVPAPWRYTSGSPSPAVRTAVSMPLTSKCSSRYSAMSAHPRRGGRAAVAGDHGSAVGTELRDDLCCELRHVLHRLPLGHVAELAHDVDAPAARLVAPLTDRVGHRVGRAAGNAADGDHVIPGRLLALGHGHVRDA